MTSVDGREPPRGRESQLGDECSNSSGGRGDGGATEEMDRGGADDGGSDGGTEGTNRRVDPKEWLAMTRRQQKNWRRRGGKFG